MASFHDVLKKLRDRSFSERDRGVRFERLMRAFLWTYPIYNELFTDIWLWNEFPHRDSLGGRDTGIDLVARTVDGMFWAIQCKCRDCTSTMHKSEVDTFLATSSRSFIDAEGRMVPFALRLWISTTNKWSLDAEHAVKNQNPPLIRLSLADLENAPVNWGALEEGISGSEGLRTRQELRRHQQAAVEACNLHFRSSTRGKLVMACGTGKTLTSLKIAELETSGKGSGLVLVLVPSIALMGQTLREWTSEAERPICPICICSDPEVSKRKVTRDKAENGIGGIEDLALPACTFVPEIVRRLSGAVDKHNGGMIVVFSTYQSIDVVSKAQKVLGVPFDIVICDEAHRTTGVTLKGDEDAAFVKVHDNSFIVAEKRLYMTATPRLYRDKAKKTAQEAEAYLCSMDDEAIYGPEIFRIGFGEAVDEDLLSDYKVLVLTMNAEQIPESLQHAIADKNQEISTDDAAKLIGCINALSKRMLVDEGLLKLSDPSPMHRAVAFCQTIERSKAIKRIFNNYKDQYYSSLTSEQREQVVGVQAEHVDGTMGASMRDDMLSWLKNGPAEANECRILTNVRCLSEGVDVPSLDAVIFLSARNSEIDVVQSVGRVMRRAAGKQYGYIVIPVVVPSDVPVEAVLEDSERFKVVWTVLNALRAHDDRFEAMVNKIDLNRRRPDGGGSVVVGGVPKPDGAWAGDGAQNRRSAGSGAQFLLPYDDVRELQRIIYARMVQKVGNGRYWEQWAQDVAEIARNYIDRINILIARDGKHKTEFDGFLAGLRRNINPGVREEEVVEMLAQHLITKPVFEALFENHSFVQRNPVSQALQRMVDVLEEQALGADVLVLSRFYESVKLRVSGIDNAEGRQRIIIELYDKFFKTAFPMTVEKLGIVYTPVEIVDFINQSVADVLRREFNRDISDENVHVLDPFTGTGTFIARLIQSGLIARAALPRKYKSELHANEIVLLAYYIASINIENARSGICAGIPSTGEGYVPFEGICLTDTFQLGESDDTGRLFSELFQENSERAIAQQNAPIVVIVGNPPYSIGQRSANDNAQNQCYPKLEKRIAETYVAETSATNRNSLYDSYIKAFRWASDRLDSKHGGIIAFVSNAGWIDGIALDGFRSCLEREFSLVYVLNLRGNCRTSGETRRKEAGNVFGLGSRTPIAITVLVKKPGHQRKASILYHDIGEYLSREQKLAAIADSGSVLSPKLIWEELEPNEHADWIHKRTDEFASFIPLGDKNGKANAKTVFEPFYSNGLKTQRDAWCYNFSSHALENAVARTIEFFNEQRAIYQQTRQQNCVPNAQDILDNDPRKISWTRDLVRGVQTNRELAFDKSRITEAAYRPFCKQNLYFDRGLNEMLYLIPKLFPAPRHGNVVISISGQPSDFPLVTTLIPDHSFNSQCFPLYWYEPQARSQLALFGEDGKDYVRRDGLTDFVMHECRRRYDPKVTKEDIFYYVYGMLHSPDYRLRFAADLAKMLPHIPLLEKSSDFRAFVKAGRELGEIHLNYESVPPCPDVVVTGAECSDFRVEKMRFVAKDDKGAIQYNEKIRVENIPLAAYRYVLNGKSAIEWVMDRYQIKIDKDSQIRNDPNDWAIEHGRPRYVLDLLLSVVEVSLRTVGVVMGLPRLEHGTVACVST